MLVRALRDIDVKGVAELFGLLGEPSRLKIDIACLDGPLGAGEIAEAAGLSQSLASHHLRLLRTAHLLRAERSGKSVRYGIDDEHVSQIVRAMVAHVCEPHPHHAGDTDPQPRGEADGHG